jgi:hypothetical protein
MAGGKSTIINGVFNDYALKPKNLSSYTSFRGVTDFSQIGYFNQYETGYQFLSVLQMPKFMDMLAEKGNDGVRNAHNAFRNMLENEFRGLEGLPDIQADTYEITDGINSVRMINRVTEDTAITVSMQFFEKQGSLIERYSEYYLTGIKDLKTQAKTYHGLIRNGEMEPSLENEVFTLLFYATDNTMLRIERAVLLCNCQLTKAEASMYNGSRADINNHEVTVEFNCFPVRGVLVDHAAKTLLEDITGVKVDGGKTGVDIMEGNTTSYDQGSKDIKHSYNLGNGKPKNIYLDSSDFRYGIMSSDSKTDNVGHILFNAEQGNIVSRHE